MSDLKGVPRCDVPIRVLRLTNGNVRSQKKERCQIGFSNRRNDFADFEEVLSQHHRQSPCALSQCHFKDTLVMSRTIGSCSVPAVSSGSRTNKFTSSMTSMTPMFLQSVSRPAAPTSFFTANNPDHLHHTTQVPPKMVSPAEIFANNGFTGPRFLFDGAVKCEVPRLPRDVVPSGESTAMRAAPTSSVHVDRLGTDSTAVTTAKKNLFSRSVPGLQQATTTTFPAVTVGKPKLRLELTDYHDTRSNTQAPAGTGMFTSTGSIYDSKDRGLGAPLLNHAEKAKKFEEDQVRLMRRQTNIGRILKRYEVDDAKEQAHKEAKVENRKMNHPLSTTH